MAAIRHRVGINAPQARVYEALATTEGVSGWWSRTVGGDSIVGGTLRFFFGSPQPSAVMEVVDLYRRSGGLALRAGTDEWVGTNLTFDLKRDGDQTVVLFSHADWREPVEFMYHCSTKWAVLSPRAQGRLRRRYGYSVSRDLKISSWG